MAAGLHELVWVAVLLDSCPEVPVLGLRLYPSDLEVGGGYVPVTVVDVHAASHGDAETLAAVLGLREDPTRRRVSESEFYGATEWREWSGWVADGSRESAVVVQVTAGDRIVDREPGDLWAVA